MGKWAKYTKKHNKEWEHEPLLKGWLIGKQKNVGSGTGLIIESYCKVCNIELRSHKADLLKHAGTSKHKSNMSKIDKTQLSIHSFGINKISHMRKRNELILSAYVATHTTIRSVDHIGEIINKINVKSTSASSLTQSTSNTAQSETIKLHRTKCSALIKEVIAPSLMFELIKDVGDSPFSIIVDESTDVSTEKLLCVCIKYYSQNKNEIITQFLTFIAVKQATAENLFTCIFDFFKSINCNLNRLIGIGTDGANSLCGTHHSLYTLLKEKLDLDNLILVKCICHTLHLCASKASEVFKDEVDFLLKETYNWFKYSSLRVAKYKEIFDLINLNEKNKFSKLTQLSATRWLSRFKAVEKILSQYLELETFFSINYVTERCHTAKILYDTYKNKENKLILQFLLPYLKQIYNLNVYFQKTDIDHYKSYKDIMTFIWSLVRQILKPGLIEHLNLESLPNSLKYDNNYLALDDCDFGYYFQKEFEAEAAHMSPEQILLLKQKCLDFIKVLILELVKRMPTHIEVFQKAQNFSPTIILNHRRPKFTDLPLQFAQNSISELEVQYRNILSVSWSEIFPEGIPDDPLKFWKKVITLKNAAGDLLFFELSIFAFKMLSLPSSNASVERVFSIMNLVKTKIRNKMMLKLLNSILIIKYHFYVNNICCQTFEPSDEMLTRFTSNMYETKIHKSEHDNIETDIEEAKVFSICEKYL
ncbi:uncharacterized protein [Diabrotica undecimpunctata]|uniref:uncharacterized protein n=1 Tax=Diabrotica undecimpunctata TaxID=50387 RepID=UPI003B639635